MVLVLFVLKYLKISLVKQNDLIKYYQRSLYLKNKILFIEDSFMKLIYLPLV